MRIAAYTIPVAALGKLPESERNILLSLMLAHNELGTLNKLLIFSLKEVLEDALGQLSHSTQTFLILKLMAGKFHETWNLVQKYYVKKKLDVQYNGSLDDSAKDAYQKLKAYFAPSNKGNVIKFIRDTAAFHYAGFDYGKTLNDLAEGEDKIYVAEHPANSLYYIGEAANWRALVRILQDMPDATSTASPAGVIEKPLEKSIDEKYRETFTVINRHINDINYQMHAFLYGVIKVVIERTLGKDWEHGEHEMIAISGAPNPYDVALPTLVDMEAARTQSDASVMPGI
jgi:hypothetical protein